MRPCKCMDKNTKSNITLLLKICQYASLDIKSTTGLTAMLDIVKV